MIVRRSGDHHVGISPSPQRPGRAALLGVMVTCLALAAADAADAVRQADSPHIIVILADDLGYGDLKCFNPEGKIATPRLDRLAGEGMLFTDAHSGSAVCTPTRYGLLTGRYSWRSSLKSGVLGGFSPRLIEAGRLTLPGLLKQKGYATAALGKWHLGMDWPLKDGGIARDDRDGWKVDYGGRIGNGPRSVGFDYYFGISASLDMPPYVFIEDDRATAIPTVEKTWIRTGPAAAAFEAIDVLPELIQRANKYLRKRAATPDKPFFLYLPLNAPHTPILPTGAWQGRSGLNAYADFVMQVDAGVGQLIDTLSATGMADNTLLVFTSDNGCSPMAKIEELQAKGHHPSYHFRGHKADIFDGGHRVPLLVRWPGKISPGSKSDQLVCLTDLMATCAAVVGAQLPDEAGEDSVNLLPAMLGQARKPLRQAVVHHSINGSFSIRQGDWKLCLCPDSGGWSPPRPGSAAAKGLPSVQLYRLSEDLGERQNVQAEHPEVVARMTRLLEQYVSEGRSTPGRPQPNTSDVQIRPREAAAPKARKKS